MRYSPSIGVQVAVRTPVFITGTQRSGTTLLCSMLNMHSRLFVENELEWVIHDRLAETSSSAELAELRSDLAESLDVPDLEIGRPEQRFAGFALLSAAMKELVARHDKNRWCLKDPHLTYGLELFQRAYPDSPFILLIRDGRAVTNSYIHQRWYVANAYYGALLWDREIQIQLDFAHRHPNRTLVLKYEELVLDAEAALRRVMEHIGEPFEPQMLDFFKVDNTFRINEYNINITKPLRASIIDKWRQELTPHQISTIDFVAGERLVGLGYELAGRQARPSALYKGLCGIHQAIMVNYWWQKRARILPGLSWLQHRFRRRPPLVR